MAFRALWVPAVVLLLAMPRTVTAQNLMRDTQRACDRGEVTSCTVLGLIYETGAGGVRDPSRALDLYQRACEGGVAEGCARVALAQAAPADAATEDPTEGPQMRRGYIADAETGAPIGEALVEIPRLGIRVLADDAGRVTLGPLPRGRYQVVAGRLGYVRLTGELPVPWDTDFLMLLNRTQLDEDETLGRIVGRVVDETTGQGMPNVEVLLSGPAERRVVTGPDGRFAVPALEPGATELTFTHLGYGTRTTSVAVQAGTVLEVSATLAMTPIELEPIEVRVGSRYLDRSGFYRRSVLAMGTQFSRRDIVAMNAVSMADIVMRVPGVTTTMERGRTSIVTSRAPSRLDTAEGCRVRTYLDGMPMHDWDLEFLRPDDLEGIEVYHGASTPIEYQYLVDPDGVYPCGVALIWTRRND